MNTFNRITPAEKFIKNLKPGYIIVILVLLTVIVIRLALPGMVKSYVNKKLNELPGYTGHVDDIHIHLIRGAYAVEGLILKKNSDPAKYPFLTIAHTDMSLEWKWLFKGRLVGAVNLYQPVIHILATEDLSKEPSKDSWTKTVKALMPIRINKLDVSEGKFAYVDYVHKPNTNLHIDHMRLSALNLANAEKIGNPLPSQVSLSGTSIGDGHLTANMKVNILKKIPDFDGGMELKGVNLIALNGFLEANLKFDIEKGDIDILSKLKLSNSELNGYVKPFINNLKVLDVKKDIKKKGGILRVAKKAVIGLFAKAVKNPKTKKIATVIPIKGNVKNPKISGWATFVGILKNAFVQAFHESLTNEIKDKKQTSEDK